MSALSDIFHTPRPAFLALICLFMGLVAATASAQTFSPFQFGLREAQTPTDVYRVLLRTHQAADSCGGRVSYVGIDTLRLEVPPEAQSIPLQSDNDFGGAVFVVTNTANSLFLFSHTPAASPIPVGDTLALCRAIDNGDFRGIAPLNEGDWLLHIIDSTPWVDRREGSEYGHYREDIVTIHDGISADRPAMPYIPGGSRPTLLGRRLDSITPNGFSFSNITLLRDSASSASTYLLQLENLPQATLRNIVVVTPVTDRIGANDAIIYIYNSANVFIDTLVLWGTYSRLNHSGYGLLMGNLRNTRIRALSAISEWGIFGTNNMVNTFIEHSDFNRFDIHCYGRDVTIDHCLQRNGYNQFSSVYGTIALRFCTFDNFTPVIIEDSYKAYSHFLLSIDSCRWYPSADHKTIFQGGSIDSRINSRQELQTPALPDIEINNLDITTSRKIRRLELFHMSGRENRAHLHGGLQHIVLHGVSITGNSSTLLLLSNKRVNLLQEAIIDFPNQEPKAISRISPLILKIGR